MIEVVEVNTSHRAQVKQFLDLPFKIYKDIPQWVPPLAMDAARMLDCKRHPFYKHSDAAFFLAVEPTLPPSPPPLGEGRDVRSIAEREAHQQHLATAIDFHFNWS